MYWNFFRNSSESYTCYYEPFHESLLSYVGSGATTVDETHTGVSDYWKEYRQLDYSILENLWRPWFGRERWSMSHQDQAADMAQFIQLLIEQSPGRPVIKFVRAGFRVSWLRKTFPDALIIHLVRNPRNVWESIVKKQGGSDDKLENFARFELGFIDYFLNVSNELNVGTSDHLYQDFYVLMARHFQSVEDYADHTWHYEQTVEDIEAWIQKANCKERLLDKVPELNPPSQNRHSGIHPDEWYLCQELSAVNRLNGVNQLDPSINSLKDQVKYFSTQQHLMEQRNKELVLENLRYKEQLEFRNGNFHRSAYFKILKNIKRLSGR